MAAPYAPYGALGNSASTSISLALSDAVDLDIVEEILTRASDATSFPQVHDVYHDVLLSHGIKPSSDKLYYEFLVKLGMIKARNWGERWDVWRDSHAMRLARADTPKMRTKGSTTSRHAASSIRSRVPFLASASSDLDEAFYEGSEAASEGVAERESPRKAMAEGMRSLVGYTPAQSDADDSFEPYRPMRSATPVYAQDHGYFADALRETAVTPTPPPYSESEANSTVTSVIVPLGPVTPALPRVRQLVAEKHVDPAVLRELERRADAFDRLGLMGRCWGAWRQSAEWIYRTSKQIDSVRDTLLLQQSLNKWRAVHEYHLSRPGTADAHYEHKRKQEILDRWLVRLRDRRLEKLQQQYATSRDTQAARQAWKTWRTKLAKRRTKRWENDMRARETSVVQKFNDNRARKAFDKWHDAARQKKADRHFVQTTVRQAFTSWQKNAERSRTLDQNLRSWERKRGSATIVRTFDVWIKKAHLRPLEDKATKHREGQLVARTWARWQLAARQQQAATAFDHGRVQKNALSRLRTAMNKARQREQLAREYALNRDRALLRKSMNIWMCDERGRLLERVLQTRKVQGLFGKWKMKKTRVENLNAKADRFRAASTVRRLHNGLSRWRDVLGQKRNATLKADLIFEARTKHTLFTKWHIASAKLADNTVTADKAYAFFTLRATFKVWRGQLAQKRQDAFIERKRRKDVKDILDLWREALAQSVRDRQQIEQFRAAQDKRLLGQTLSFWTERVVQIKLRELEVAEHRDRTIVADGFARWRRAHKRKTDLVALLQSFLDVKQEDTIRRAFSTWSVRARKARDLHNRLEFFEKERDERLLSEAFTSWHDLKRESDLAAIEQEVALRHEDAILFSIFDTWTGRGRLLKAVQFDQQRVRQAFFPKWRKALRRTQKLKAVAAEHNLRLLADGFAVWKSAYRAKIAKYPTTRARRRLSHRESLHDPTRRPPAGTQLVKTPRARHSLGSAPWSTGSSAPGSRPRSALQSRSRGGSESPDTYGERETHRPTAAASVVSEPAYSRLRSELLGRGGRSGRDRVVSDETPLGMASMDRDHGVSGTGSRTMSELVRALSQAR